jgi:CheY-like chemotaxis protein
MIVDLVSNEHIEATVVTAIAEACQYLIDNTIDCIILDGVIEQSAKSALFDKLQNDEKLSQIPVIIYTERDLTAQEETTLQDCAESLTIKAVKSPERLLDEVTLFLHQVEAQLSVEKRDMLHLVHNKEAILAHKKVLLVDDDVRNTFALMTFLEEKGMEIIVGYTGKEALELLEQNPDTSVVLMDIMMPEMDGYEAMKKIKAQPRFRKLPIIALTAKAMKGDKVKCIEAGANDYLTKPVDTDRLLSLLRVWLYQ